MPAQLDLKTTDYSKIIDDVIDNFLVANEEKLRPMKIDFSSLRYEITIHGSAE